MSGPTLGLASGPPILMVEHDLGGGVRKHVQDLINLFSRRARFMVLGPVAGGLIRVRHNFAGLPGSLYFDVKREMPALGRFLAACSLSRIHFHHTIQLPWEIAQLPRKLGVPYDFSAHDYFPYCPQITLVTERFRYCGEPDITGCNTCLALRPAPGGETIEGWRSRFAPFLAGAARVLVPAPSVVARLRRHFPDAKLILAPHPEPTATLPPPRWRHPGKRPMKVLVLGALNPTKGPDLLEACAIDARARGLAIEFHLLGSAYRRLVTAPHSALTVHGPYRDEELDVLIERLAPDIAWFPAQWPETYSYTLSAVLRLGLPVLAPDLGAFHDRLAGRTLSWVLPWDASPSAWNDALVAVAASPEAGRRWLVDGVADAAVFSYERDYLLPAPSLTAQAPIVDRSFAAHGRAWRFSKEYFSGRVLADVHHVLRRIYAVPAIRKLATFLVPEYRIQMLRRWLGRY